MDLKGERRLNAEQGPCCWHGTQSLHLNVLHNSLRIVSPLPAVVVWPWIGVLQLSSEFVPWLDSWLGSTMRMCQQCLELVAFPLMGRVGGRYQVFELVPLCRSWWGRLLLGRVEACLVLGVDIC